MRKGDNEQETVPVSTISSRSKLHMRIRSAAGLVAMTPFFCADFQPCTPTVYLTPYVLKASMLVGKGV